MLRHTGGGSVLAECNPLQDIEHNICLVVIKVGGVIHGEVAEKFAEDALFLLITTTLWSVENFPERQP